MQAEELVRGHRHRRAAGGRLAQCRHGVAVGAHPGYPDREGFGRREIDITHAELRSSVREQLEALGVVVREAGARVVHVKPHGLLYNKAAADPVLARLLASIREDGRPLSCLYPFRESFYERLGYVTFPLPRTAKLTPSALLPLLKEDLGGEIEFCVGGQPLTFSTSAGLFIPKGLRHGPLACQKYRKPHIVMAIMLGAGTMKEGWENSFIIKRGEK